MKTKDFPIFIRLKESNKLKSIIKNSKDLKPSEIIKIMNSKAAEKGRLMLLCAAREKERDSSEI